MLVRHELRDGLDRRDPARLTAEPSGLGGTGTDHDRRPLTRPGMRCGSRLIHSYVAAPDGGLADPDRLAASAGTNRRLGLSDDEYIDARRSALNQM
jgi:hypothetical protein